MEVLIFWALCAGLAMALAPEGKRGTAALLGTLLGPIGVVIVALQNRGS